VHKTCALPHKIDDAGKILGFRERDLSWAGIHNVFTDIGGQTVSVAAHTDDFF
jgi:hypothetical protein